MGAAVVAAGTMGAALVAAGTMGAALVAAGRTIAGLALVIVVAVGDVRVHCAWPAAVVVIVPCVGVLSWSPFTLTIIATGNLLASTIELLGVASVVLLAMTD